MSRKTTVILIFISCLAPAALTSAQTADSGVGATAATGPDSAWSANLDPAVVVENLTKPERLSASLQILLLMTVLSLAPAILVMTTCFTRIVIVLALLRQAMATQQLPPSQVIMGLALFMTICVMAPTWSRINAEAIQPYVSPVGNAAPISASAAFDRAKSHMRKFMIAQIENTGNTESVYMFVEFSNPDVQLQKKITDETLQWQDVPLTSLIPAYITSELKQAFLMGFYIYLPFLVIDMVIASILMSMGMMMLPPVLISLPFKLLLFVLVDGWRLVIGTLMSSFTNNLAF